MKGLNERRDVQNKAACLKKQEPCNEGVDAAERYHVVQAPRWLMLEVGSWNLKIWISSCAFKLLNEHRER